MNEQLLNQIQTLLTPELWQVMINPRQERPYQFSSSKRKRSYQRLSAGEQVLVRLAYDLWNNSGKVNLGDLICLDLNYRTRALNALQNSLGVHP